MLGRFDMETTLISGGVALIVAAITAFFAFRGKRDENNIAEIQTVLEGYKEIVLALNSEISRLRGEIQSMRKAMDDCEERNDKLQLEVEKLRTCVTRLERGLTNGD